MLSRIIVILFFVIVIGIAGLLAFMRWRDTKSNNKPAVAPKTNYSASPNTVYTP